MRAYIQPTPVSALSLVGLYTALIVGAVVVFNLIGMALPFSNPAYSLVLVLFSAGLVARRWVDREQGVPPGGRAWWIATLASAAATLVFVCLAVLVVGLDRLAQDIRSAGAPVAVVAVALFAGIQLICIRLGFWIAFRRLAKTFAR